MEENDERRGEGKRRTRSPSAVGLGSGECCQNDDAEILRSRIRNPLKSMHTTRIEAEKKLSAVKHDRTIHSMMVTKVKKTRNGVDIGGTRTPQPTSSSRLGIAFGSPPLLLGDTITYNKSSRGYTGIQGIKNVGYEWCKSVERFGATIFPYVRPSLSLLKGKKKRPQVGTSCAMSTQIIVPSANLSEATRISIGRVL